MRVHFTNININWSLNVVCFVNVNVNVIYPNYEFMCGCVFFKTKHTSWPFQRLFATFQMLMNECFSFIILSLHAIHKFILHQNQKKKSNEMERNRSIVLNLYHKH